MPTIFGTNLENKITIALQNHNPDKLFMFARNTNLVWMASYIQQFLLKIQSVLNLGLFFKIREKKKLFMIYPSFSGKISLTAMMAILFCQISRENLVTSL